MRDRSELEDELVWAIALCHLFVKQETGRKEVGQMYVRYEGTNAEGETVSALLPLILALRGHEPVLPGVKEGTVKASITDEGPAEPVVGSGEDASLTD